MRKLNVNLFAERLIVPVVGMHRSGTSAVAGALHAGGISMGSPSSFYPPPYIENEAGFFEDVRFRRINDRMSERAGYHIKTLSPFVPKFEDTRGHEVQRLALLLRRTATQPAWGWKDPRTCLFLEPWLSSLERIGLLGSTKILYVYRKPLSVAKSLEVRDGMRLDDALHLWTIYNERALNIIERGHAPTCFLSYESFLANPAAEWDRLSSFFGRPLEPAGVATLQPSLAHNKPTSVRAGGANGIELKSEPRAAAVFERLHACEGQS